MQFNEAQSFLNKGSCIARSGWNGKGLYVTLAHAVVLPDGGPIEDFYYITSGERRNVWVPSSSDLLADDWDLVVRGTLRENGLIETVDGTVVTQVGANGIIQYDRARLAEEAHRVAHVLKLPTE